MSTRFPGALRALAALLASLTTIPLAYGGTVYIYRALEPGVAGPGVQTQNQVQLSVSPANIAFGSTAVGSTLSQTVTLTNTGSQNLVFGTLSTSGSGFGYNQASGCGSVLTPGQACTLQAFFAPIAAGSANGQLTINSNANGSPAVIDLSGTGQGAALNLSATSLSFPSVSLGQSSAQTVTVTAGGNETLSFTGVSLSGASSGFSEANTCGASLAPGGSCTITVTYAPTVNGTSTDTLTINSNAYNGAAQQIALSGSGTGPVLALSEASYNFGNVLLGQSGSNTLTLTNSGGSSLSLSSISLTGSGAGFTESNGCGSSLAAGQSCTVTLSFSPAALGAVSNALTIASNAANGNTQSVTLTGTGTGAIMGLTPNTLSFGAVSVSQPATQSFTVSNAGTAPLQISAISESGAGFTESNDCASQVLPSSTCTVTVTFAPTVAGQSYSGSVTVASNATNTPTQSVSLAGSGALATASLTIASNVTNYNVANALGNPTTPENITVTVNSGVTVSSASTATAALDEGALPAGSTVTLINNGFIVGAGGAGGTGGSETSATSAYTWVSPTPGGNGGPAINATVATTVENNMVLGGGGGGGGGGSECESPSYPTSGGGGGGGEGPAAGGAAGQNSYLTADVGAAGVPGSAASAGQGGSGFVASGTQESGNGGNGGGLGSAGAAGQDSPSYCTSSLAGTFTYGAAGGAAGPAILTNGNTVTVTGNSVLGAIQ